MKTELSEYYKRLKPFVLQMPFGTYFFFEKFIVSEINEGVHFEWNMAEKLALEVFKYYGKDAKLGFISNRVNRHSVDPQNWIKLEKNHTIIIASAIVAYDKLNFMNASIEKKFTKNSIKRCKSLNEAIKWILELEEFK